MKILATLDGSAFSESILPQLDTLCALPNVELTLLRVGPTPHGRLRAEARSPVAAATFGSAGAPAIVLKRPAPEFAETKEQAVERTSAELREYLDSIAMALSPDVPCRVEAMIDDHAASAIVRFAMAERPDMIVMATHGHTGLVHILFGDVAESVVKSGVAPVLLVHPDEIRVNRAERERDRA